MQERNPLRALLGPATYKAFFGEPDRVLAQLHRGEIGFDEFVEITAKATYDSQTYLLRLEQERIRRLEENLGMESLTTDTVGSRSAGWFHGSKPFATGIASTCLAIAIIHPEVGMAASHRNPVTVEIVRKAIRRSWEGRTSGLPFEFQHALTPEDIPPFLERTTSEAFQEFDKLHPSKRAMKEGIYIGLIGMKFIAPEAAQVVLEEAIRAIRANIHRRKQFPVVNLSIASHIGEVGGIIYGGRTHPTLSSPGIYRG